MDLILWRHAEAEDGQSDEQRGLTPRGEKQAAAMAAWLGPRLPRDIRILVSPARRAQQTAKALSRDFSTVPEVGVGASAGSILTATEWPRAGGTVLAVGHQPALGEVAALLLSGTEATWSLKKGAVWWFTYRIREEQPETILRLAISPEFL
jgi:phosphohistidine phosphatase